MNSGEIDRIPMHQVVERYDVARSAVYKRMEDLGIKPQRVGNKAYLNARQLTLMDELHQFLKAGGTTPEFLESRNFSRPDNPTSEESLGLSRVTPDIIQLVSAIAAQFAARMQPSAEPDRFAYFETLERAARNGWLLSTSELAYLLDLSPSEMKHYGDRFSEAGFTFTKAGYRAGGETAWKVSKERS